MSYRFSMLETFQAWLRTPAEGLDLAPEDRDIFPMTGYTSHLGLAAHSFNVPMFALLGATTLAWFNVVSVICFVVAIMLWRRGLQRTCWFLMIFEVLAHAGYCCMVFGWDSGFHYPVTVLIPIIFLATSYSMVGKFLMGVAIVGSYMSLSYICPDQAPGADAVLNQRFNYYNMVILFLASAGVSGYYGSAVRSSRKAVAREFERAESLLLNVLPGPIAERLKAGEAPLADAFSDCTVLFADIVGFTPLSASLDAADLVGVLNDIFTRFDQLAEELGLEKIKTIGDCYMVASGIPVAREDHALVMARMALAMRDVIQSLDELHGHRIDVRIGLHSGPAVAGVIGERKFIYDLWGDTVNIAARMESHGVPGEIQVSEATYGLIKDGADVEERGEIDVKGKGMMRTYLLKGVRTPCTGVSVEG
jgi:adenylate cyclase